MKAAEPKQAKTDEQLHMEFGRKLDALRDIITLGIACFSAWRGLTIADEDTISAVNRYRGFFVPAHEALRLSALLQFSKVFDRDPRTASLRILLGEARANRAVFTPYASEQDLTAIETRIEARKPVIDALKHLRDTRLAHYDVLVATSPPTWYGDMLLLIEDIKSMYNVLRSGHSRAYEPVDYLGEHAGEQTSAVVRIMCEARDRDKQRIEEAMKDIES